MNKNTKSLLTWGVILGFLYWLYKSRMGKRA